MAEWKVVYQNTPFNFTDPGVLVIDAEGIEQALATAYDALTRRGLAVGVINTDGADESKIRSMIGLAPNISLNCMSGPTHIRSCTLHQTAGLGRVLQA
jgi:hypothetical protein